MLEVIERARAAEPLGLLMLDEQDHGGRAVAVDAGGEQWVPVDEPLRCLICDEDGKDNAVTAQDGWRHLLTGAGVCSDCVGFTGEEFPFDSEELDALLDATRDMDGDAATEVMRAARARLYAGAAR